MKIIQIHRQENLHNLSYDFTIIILGIFKVKKYLSYEQVVMDRLPKWLIFSKWLLQKTCHHKWEKNGSPRMEGYFFGDGPTTMIQNVICKVCEKEDFYKYKRGIDTSF